MVELEALPAAYFACGCYGHLKNLCPSITLNQCIENGNAKSSTLMVEGSTMTVGEEPFGPWMIGGANFRHLENRKTVTGNMGQLSCADCLTNLDGQNVGDLAPTKQIDMKRQRNNRHDRTLSKIIRGRGGCFKVAGNSHLPFSETMTSIVRFIGSQAVLEAYRT
ncbi:hypothetical protein Gogos_019876, partial [Gossypium gossypioides]|nr:hypothetical protein [Gossypium gossypioides]